MRLLLPSDVTATFADGTLTITGAASVSAYEAILKSVTFSNISEAPSTVARQITFTVSDGADTSVGRVIDLMVSDLTAPTATISATGEQITNGMATAQIVFSEAVTGFTKSDLTITDGVIDHVTMLGDKTAIVTFKPTGSSGSLTLSGDYADLAGNAGAKGAALSFTTNAPQMIGGDTSARIIDEDLNNTGRTIIPGVAIVDADNHDFAGGSLRAHTNHRVGFANVAGEVLGIRGLSDGSGCFRAVGDDIYYRQPTGVASNGSVPASDAPFVEEIRIGSIATIGGVRQDGSRGAELVINLNENATPAITQTLASNIVFGVKLSGGAYTQAWQDFAGTNTSVLFTLSDGQGNSSTLLTPIDVIAHNDAPVATSDAQAIGQAATDPATGNVLANDTDADNVPGLTQQTLTVAGVASGANHATFTGHSATLHGQYGVLTISDTGAYSYVLDNDNKLVHSLVTGERLVEKFTYDVSDGIATVGSKLEITINGTAANVAPVANADQANASNTGDLISGNILANDTDPNGQSLQVTDAGAGTGALEPVKSAGASLHGTYGDLTLTADGAYTYTPDVTNTAVKALTTGQTLTETYNYSISDGRGGTLASTLTITIDGTVENTPPVANADEAAMNNTDDPVTGNVLLNDTDANGQTLHVTGVPMSLEGGTIVGQYGVLTLNADGSYSYAPDVTKTAVNGLVVGDKLTDTFNYSISDGYDGVSSSTLAITINGTVPNSEPVAVADEASMTNAEGSASGNVLANDTDVNGQTLQVVGVPSGTSGESFVGAYGTLTLRSDGAYTYTPDAENADVQGLVGDASLTDTFDYSISDGHGGSASSTLAITINASAPNASPTGVFDQARGTPYSDMTGNVLSNDTDPEHQALTVTGATASEGDFSGAPDATISGRFGDLTISADGHYVYEPNASAVRTSVPLFGSATETFYYRLSDGHGGFAEATLNIEVVNSPLVIKGAPGTYTVSDTIGGVTKVIGSIDILPGSQSAIWIAPDTYNPADGSHVLSVSVGGEISAFGGASSQTAGLEILDIAHLPQTPAANTLYIVHDTRANIEAAEIGDTSFTTFVNSHAVMGIIVNGAGPAAGGYETLTNSHIPVLGYDTQISLPATARTLNEDDNNTGRLIAFSGTGFAIVNEKTSAVGPIITDPELGFAAGATLRVHINNAVTNSVGGDVLFLKQGSNVFRTDVDGKIYYRQDTRIDGATSDAVTIDSNPDDDIQFASFATNTSGKFLNGMGGRDLVVTFNDKATPDLVQLLAGHIGFGIRLTTTDGTAGYTQAWQQFLPAAGLQQSVTYTITDVGGRSNSATRDIDVQAVNDNPVAHNDLAAIGKGNTGISGWVLGNDDPDLLPNQGSGSTSLPAGLAVTSVSHGTDSGALGSSVTGDYGSLNIKADGTYTYTLNTNNTAVKNLTSGALLDVFHYTMTDGSASSSADLKIMIDAVGAHWGSESKTSSNTVTVADTIFKHAGASETQYVYGFAGNDVLGAVGPGTVKVDGGDGDDVMFALAAHTSLKGGAGLDTFVIGSADIDLRIEDLQLLSNPAGHDTVDFSLIQQALGMTKEQLWAYNEAHVTEVTDASTGKLSTELSFAGAGHSGKVLFVGVTGLEVGPDMPGLFDGSLPGGYGLLDELKLIAANHG
jgi:VCBS repeat-containing protein